MRVSPNFACSQVIHCRSFLYLLRFVFTSSHGIVVYFELSTHGSLIHWIELPRDSSAMMFTISINPRKSSELGFEELNFRRLVLEKSWLSDPSVTPVVFFETENSRHGLGGSAPRSFNRNLRPDSKRAKLNLYGRSIFIVPADSTIVRFRIYGRVNRKDLERVLYKRYPRLLPSLLSISMITVSRLRSKRKFESFCA